MKYSYESKICGYDGITLFIKDPAFKQHLFNDSERYGITTTHDFISGKEIGFKGRFGNFDIESRYTPTDQGVSLGGSLHKWKNKTHNYDNFYYEDLDLVISEIIDEFKFDPLQTDI